VTTPRLSKTRFISGCQCHLKLWYDCFERDLGAEVDAVTQAIFDTGHEVGRIARQRYPGGVLVEADHRHAQDAIAQTRALLADDSVPAIFEAAFEHRNVLVRVDVLERSPRGGFNLIEVKSGTSVKDVHERDVAVQRWVLRGAGVDVASAGLLTLSRGYVFDGKRLDVYRLFRFHDLDDAVGEHLPWIGEDVTLLHSMLSSNNSPQVEPGDHCFEPYECGYYEFCTRDWEYLEHPISDLPRLRETRREQLLSQNIEEIGDIPVEFRLSDRQAIVRQAVITGKEYVAPELQEELLLVSYPIRYLDFESFNPAIPRYAGTRCYDAIPFQFSMHTEDDGGNVSHHEFLWTETSDPRRPLAEALLHALGAEGTVCVYSGFERRVIKALSRDLPDLSSDLDALLERLWDLLKVIERNYYHPDFHGSFSIKQVLPALVPEMRYEGMTIGDGREASAAYQNSLDCDDANERQGIHQALREYCAQDTLAMLALRRTLMERASAKPPSAGEPSRP
jgi:hypothetical protein